MPDKAVLIIWEHGGNLGHLSRLQPIAIALKSANFKVIFATADEIGTRRYFGAENFSFVNMPRMSARPPSESGVLNHADILLRAGFSDGAGALACVMQWHALFKSVNPMAVLVDSSPLALYAAQSAGLPVVALGHGFEIAPTQQERPCFTPWAEDADAKAAAFELLLQQSFESLAKSLPASSRPKAPMSIDTLYRPDRAALCTWPELDHFDRSPSQQNAVSGYTGPIWSEPLGGTFQEWPDRSGPKVLCYLNLRDKRYDLIWQALKNQGANILEISPYGVPRACQAARGWGIEVVEQPVQLNPLIPACDAVVGHGGMGLTSMALHHGKPVFLLPEHMEQAILAYRLSKQGLAVATIKHKDKTLVQTKIDQLINDTDIKLRARRFSLQKRDDSPEAAAQAVVGKLVDAGA
jgi:hypothetical protein